MVKFIRQITIRYVGFLYFGGFKVLSSVLQTKLEAIDTACEASTRNEIDDFYRNVRYDGSSFRYPSFQDVGGVWLKLIQKKEQEFATETQRILDATVTIDEDQLADTIAIVEGLLRDDRYIDRLKVFSDGVVRKAASYGLSFTPEACRLDIADSAYRAGVQNALRAARANISTELQLYFSNKGLRMGFSSLMTDTVSVLKKDGNKFDGIKASVQTNKIFINGSDLLIESGDLIRRKMSNGGEETFEVIDPGFHEKFHSIPAGYQMDVKKLGIPEAQKAVQTITYTLTGHNPRIIQNSIDNSTNVVSINPGAVEYIAALRRVILEASLSPQEKQSAVEVIDAVDAQFQTGRPSKPVVSALLAALPHVANIASIVTSLLALFGA